MTLKELREKNSLSQAALAKSIGVSNSTVASVEAGRMKVSQKISDKVKEVYGEIIEQPAVKKVQEAGKKAEAAVNKTVESVRKVEEKAKTTRAKAKAAQEKAKATVAKAKTTAAKADKQVKKTASAAKKALPKKVNVVLQSPMGGEITPDTILAKVGNVDAVYIRIDENKAYWVNGDETGSVDLW